MSPRHLPIGLALVFVLLLTTASALAQASDAAADLLARINHERTSRGLAPYAQNAKLTSAAQAHADDMARTAKYSHTGSDGSTVFDRAARVGYGAYSWGRRVGENYAVYHDVQTAMKFWMGSAPHRSNILHSLYREIGIGVARSPQRGGFVYVLVFGAEPNVLPIFINDDAAATGSSNVTLTLDDEGVSDGSTKNIYQVKQVQVSNDAGFGGAAWQPYAARIPWTLAPGGGTKTVYVKYQDAHGVTTTSSDTITFGVAAASKDNQIAAPAAPTAKPTATQTRRPTATVTRTPRPRPTRTNTPRPTRTSTPEPTDTPTPALTIAAVEEPTLVLVALRQGVMGVPNAGVGAPQGNELRVLAEAVLRVTDPFAFVFLVGGMVLGGVAAAKYAQSLRIR